MALVTRYLLVDRVERDVNSALTSLFIGSDRQSGWYDTISGVSMFDSAKKSCLSSQCPYVSPCCLGAMPSCKGSDARSVKMFPSQQKSSQSEK